MGKKASPIVWIILLLGGNVCAAELQLTQRNWIAGPGRHTVFYINARL